METDFKQRKGRESRAVSGIFLADLPSSPRPGWVMLAEFIFFFQERPVSSISKNGKINMNIFPYSS